MAQNKMEDLRNHLFAALERLGDEELTPEELDREVKRSQAIGNVAQQVIQSAKIEVDFIKATGMIGTDTSLFKSVVGVKKIGQSE